MADIKDKVITAESLKALHDYNKDAYMLKNDPAGSGSLSINRKADTTVGNCSVALGDDTTASGAFSYAEGKDTVAKDSCCHAEGRGTIALIPHQHVQGTYNIEDTESEYAHIVGNGRNPSSRSNAHTIDWDGNAWFASDVYVGGSSQSDATKLVKSANITSIEYGDTLPAAGTVGRIFFKKLSE